MTLLRRLIGVLAIFVGCLWLLIAAGVISAPNTLSESLWGTFILFMAIQAVMDWRDRGRRPISEPSAALSGATVILLTGLAAVIATAWHADAPGDFAIPTVIAVTTLAIASVVIRFARKNADNIGESTFDTSRSNIG